MRWRERARVGLLCALGLEYAGCGLVVGFDEISGKPWSSTGAGGAVGGDGGSGANNDGGGSSALILAMGELGVKNLALTKQFVHWVSSSGNTLRKVAIGGVGSPLTLAFSDGAASDLVIDAERAYWADEKGLKYAFITMSSSATFVLTPEGSGARELAIDEEYVYWTDATSGGAIKRVHKKTSSVITIVDQIYARDIAVDECCVYWLDVTKGMAKGDVKRIPLAGGAASTLASEQQALTYIYVDKTNVYWTSMQGPIAHIGTVPKNSGIGGFPPMPPLFFSPAPGTLGRLVTDEDFIYVTSHNVAGQIFKIAKNDPSSGKELFFFKEPKLFTGIAVDARYVYLSTDDGAIAQINK